MVDWENELKRYLAQKYKKEFGREVDYTNIKIIENFGIIDENIGEFEIEELAHVYAFDLMKEDFEHANIIKNELTKRNCDVNIDIDEINKTAVINVYIKPKNKIAYIDIHMKIMPNGMIIDFEKENL
jgi:hypothetical protein